MKDENYHTHSCPTCGATEDFEHSFYDWIAKDNNDHIHDCMECEYASILPHDYVREVTVEPTEAEVGEATYTCSLCSHFYTEELPKHISEVTNEKSGVDLTVPSISNAYIPEGTVFEVVEQPTEQIPEQVLGEIAVTAEGAVKPLGIFDLSLLLDGAEIQPNGTVAITLPAPDLAAEYDSIIVVYIAPDGSYEECKTTVNEDGTITFETDHFSQYAVIGISKNAVPDAESGLSAGAIVGIAVGAVVVLGIGVFFLYWFVFRKKKI
jgi:rubredoxin